MDPSAKMVKRGHEAIQAERREVRLYLLATKSALYGTHTDKQVNGKTKNNKSGKTGSLLRLSLMKEYTESRHHLCEAT